MKKIVIALLFFGFSYGHCDSSKRDLLWKARALQAMEKFEEINKNPKKFEKSSKKVICELELERAYAIYANPKTIKSLNEVKHAGEAFYLVFKDDSESKDTQNTMIQLIYDPGESTSLSFVSVMSLSTSAVFGYSPGASGTFIVGNKKCTFTFHAKDLLNGTALPNLI